MLKCESFTNFSNITTDILLFGLIHPVKPYTEQAAQAAVKNGLYFYCDVQDEQGNVYKLFSDWDPTLKITKTIAFKMN